MSSPFSNEPAVIDSLSHPCFFNAGLLIIQGIITVDLCVLLPFPFSFHRYSNGESGQATRFLCQCGQRHRLRTHHAVLFHHYKAKRRCGLIAFCESVVWYFLFAVLKQHNQLS